VPGAFNHALLAEIGEMLGNLGLRKAQNFLEMADAQRPLCKQVDDPQPRGIAKTLVNLNQFHGRNIATQIYSSIYIFAFTNASEASGEIDSRPIVAGFQPPFAGNRSPALRLTSRVLNQ
jgi:hypothetical protein